MASSKKEDQTIWLLGYYKIKDNSMAMQMQTGLQRETKNSKKQKKLKALEKEIALPLLESLDSDCRHSGPIDKRFVF